ncbi:hypothetical protein Tco_0474219 [Tanacetum coccineum]
MALQSYTIEFEKEAQVEKDRYIDLIEKSIKAIIKDEVKNQLPRILPKEVSDFATPVIQSTITESLKNVESVFEAADTEMPQNQGSNLGNTDDQPNVEAALKHDWFKKLKRPPTPNPAYVMNNLKIDNLTQEHLIVLAFNLLKGTCRSRVELEYHFEECYKSITDRLDWNNPEGQEYPFDLRKPLLLIEDQGHQVVPVDYLINNDLEYLKGGSSSRKYTTSTSKTKAAGYDDIQYIEDMVPLLWSPVKVAYDRHAV